MFCSLDSLLEKILKSEEFKQAVRPFFILKQVQDRLTVKLNRKRRQKNGGCTKDPPSPQFP